MQGRTVHRNSGGLFVFEGPDEVGKTTLARALTEALNSEGQVASYAAFPGAELGTIGPLVHRLHHRDPSLEVDSIHAASLQMMHVAAHIDAIERTIVPRLNKGTSVVLDRFWWSTWVYGLAGGVSRKSLESMIECEQPFWGAQLPDAVFLLSRKRAPNDARLWHEYGDLLEREKDKYPVHRVMNDGPIEETIREVRNYFPQQEGG